MAVMLVGQAEVLTVPDAAQLLEVTPHQVRDLVRRKKLMRRGETAPMLIDRLSVERYRQARGVWNRFNIKGGKAAAKRLRVWEGD